MKKILLWWVGFLLLITTTFAYNLPQSDTIILQRMYERLDFIYQEDPIRIQKARENLSKTQEKYKDQERFSYLLGQLSKYINKIMEKKDDEIIPNIALSNPFILNENNTLHLRSRDLGEADIVSIVTMLQQLKYDNKSIKSISFSYNSDIGDSGITRIIQSMPTNVKEIGCVACWINDAWGQEILKWMKTASNLQMICIEQNNFSEDLKQQFNIFKKQNPYIMIII